MTSNKIEIAGGIFDDYNGESFYIGVFENFPAIRIHFENCDMGDSKYDEWAIDYLKFVDCENAPNANDDARRYGSIFGEGSLAMIVAFAALIASIASIIVNVTARKKKTVPVTATESDEE